MTPRSSRSALALGPVVAPAILLAMLAILATLVLTPPPATAAAQSKLTGLRLDYGYRLDSATEGCTKKTPATINYIATGKGSAFSDTEYSSGWVVTMDVTSTEGDVLATITTKDAYTSTYQKPSLNITVGCKDVQTLLAAGYGAGEELTVAITSAVFGQDDYTLDTTGAVLTSTPSRVSTIVPETAKKTSGGYRITSQAQLWSPVEDGYGFASPGQKIVVSGLWKNCPASSTKTATNGRFTVTWKASALLKGKNFGYYLSATKKIDSFDGGWTIKGQHSFSPTESYYNGCGGA